MRGADTTNGGQTWWCGWLQSSGRKGSRQFDATQGALYPYLKGRGVELCPAFNYLSPQLKLKADGASYGYGYNAYLSGPVGRPPIKTSKVSAPSEIALFGDAAQVNDFQAPASRRESDARRMVLPGQPDQLSQRQLLPSRPFPPRAKGQRGFLRRPRGRWKRWSPARWTADCRASSSAVCARRF